MAHRFLSAFRANPIAYVLIAAAALVGGCISPFGGSGFLGLTQSSSADVTQSPEYRASVAAGIAAEQAADVAAIAAKLPTPASPIAAALTDFLDAYGGKLYEQLSAIKAQQAAADARQAKAPTTSDVYRANLAAVLAGIAAMFFRSRTTAGPPHA